MSGVTIVIPARNELYLDRTLDGIYERATGEFEVIVVLDNYWPAPICADRPNLTIVHWGGRRGMRAAVNAAAEIGKGDYLMKVDAHCVFAEGFDETLKKDCDVDWLVVPRRFSLDAETWSAKDKPPVNYEFLGYPYQNGKDLGLHGKYWWKSRERARSDFDIDENMTFQGSCYFMPMEYFRRLVYPMDEANYGMFIGEPQEIGLKVWLSGGKCMVNKNTWYAHLWKGKGYRDLHLKLLGIPYTRVGRHELDRGNAYSTDFWFNNRWAERKHDLSWLVERFWPVPTWPEEREKWTSLVTS
jgi:glycosyltransferase involved in cell wall biosynthesis